MEPPAPRSPGTGAWRDRVLVPVVAGYLALSAWFLFGGAGGAAQVLVFWLVQPLLDVGMAVFAWRVCQVATGPARRFWRVVACAGALFLAGDLLQTGAVVLHPVATAVDGGPVQTACVALGIGAMVVSMLLYPQTSRPGRERVAFWLDAATVLVAGIVLAWCFAVSPESEDGRDVVTTLIAASAVIVAAFAAVKMVLTGTAPMTRAAAAALIGAAIMQGVGIFITPHDPAAGVPGVVYAARLLAALLVVVGPRIQLLQARVDPAALTARRRKPYSLLPYGAIVVTFGALVAILPGGVNTRLWGVVGGVGVIIGLVATRQLLAFQDNVALIGRLDATLGDLRTRERQLRDQASYDGLTRLANRTHFGDLVAEALTADGDPAASSRGALLLIDLDDFKTVNDTLGHAAGDELLIVVADRIRAAIRAGDIAARLGGDEFAVLLRDADEADAARTVLRIQAALARTARIRDQAGQGHDLVVRASIGVAVAAPGGHLDPLLRDADIAMYQAKDRGKGNFVRYTPDMGLRIRTGAELAADLRDAIDRDELHLVYQPIVELDGYRMIGVEALLRWRHPQRGPLAPDEFVPVAERTGLVVPVGRWVLREACRQAARWRAESPAAADLMMSVNVAGRQLREPGFLAEVAAALADSGLPARCLSVEVTETAVFEDAEAIAVLHGLRELGTRLALDDFGTAASSLGLLLTCPVTTLKLDRSFVEAITTVTRQAAVATAVSQMAGALALTAVAEGIESPDQADVLRDLGYRYGQGFLFSRPRPPGEIGALWAAGPEPVTAGPARSLR
jgi:diguanylate cyclase (GGDEF)-like protein